MRSAVSLTLAALLLLGTTSLGQDADEASSADNVQALLKQWRETRVRATELGTRYRSSNAENKAKLLPELLAALDAAADVIAELVPVLERAHAANPDDPELREALPSIARICYEMDQMGYAYRVARLVAEREQAATPTDAIAGMAAYEMGQYDEAERYLSRAATLTTLDAQKKPLVTRTLKRIGQRREIAAAEQSRLAQDAQATEPLPRVQLNTTRGPIVIELFEDDFPNTVASFLSLVDKGFFTNRQFFRVDQSFGAITGSLHNDGKGIVGYETPREEPARGARPHLRGYVSMIPETKRTNSSQIFIVCRPSNCERLDGQQDVIGRIVEGMEVAERLRPHNASGPEDVPADVVESAEVIRLRPHEYQPITMAHLADSQFKDGVQKFQDGKHAEAEELFRSAAEYLPENPFVRFNWGATLMNLQRVEEAEEQFREAVRLDPKYLKARQFLAAVYVEQEKFDLAIGELRETLLKFPSDRATLALLKKAEELQQQAASQGAGGSTSPANP